ncbi:hypothetical protein LUZ60_006587 [Juncus effusus]|nr:hypothetical protein LUZ60_006587 [Juncus effusus]
MVDVARRTSTLPPPTPTPLRRLSGLRRLSARASSPSPPTPSRIAISSFSDLASSILSHLNLSQVSVQPGLSDSDLLFVESDLSFTFPPDLKTLLSLGVPSGNGFPDWRKRPLRPLFELPLKKELMSSRRKAPLLIPVYKNCFIPASPCLAGNPVFRVEEHCVSIAGVDLADFFSRETGFLNQPVAPLRRQLSASLPPIHPPSSSSSPSPSSRRSLDSMAGKNPRWIEFWTDAVVTGTRRRQGDMNSSQHESFFEIKTPEISSNWVQNYLNKIGSVLKSGGWCESDVKEMVYVSTSGRSEPINRQDLIDKLIVKADRCSDSLRRAGWGSDEVFELLGLDLRSVPVRRPNVRLPPKVPLAVHGTGLVRFAG